LSGERAYAIAVVERTLDVLEALAGADHPLGPTELAARTGATKTAVFRILATLERRGYVIKEAGGGRYRLGTPLAYLGGRSLQAIDLRRVARPTLEGLFDHFRETVNLGVLDGTDIVYIDMLESHHGLRMAARVGDRHPAYSTSIGKAILAFLPPRELARHLPARLERRTTQTIVDREELEAELERVRQRGVAEDRGENEVGAHCYGAPVFDHLGVPIAGISLSGPESRLGLVAPQEIESAVRLAAAACTAQLGGRPAEQPA
jgi:DNA-binding IclR family transcriptional regulator